MFPLFAKDAYKIGHIHQYPPLTEEIYSNFTPRSGRLSNVPNSEGVWVAGIQHFIIDYLIEDWNYNFFLKNKKKVVNKYKRLVDSLLDTNIDVKHIEALHSLGYLPLEIKSLPEGVFVPYGVPVLTLRNTLPEFYWVTNMIESVLSCELWLPITSATTYKAFEKLFVEYANKTGVDKSFVKYQGHDFSMRGMGTRYAAASSGAAVLSMGCVGTDNIPAIELLEEYYDANIEKEEVGKTVNATEHSVMCAGGKVDEYETYRRIIEDLYPKGNISIVSDTWDFWGVVTNILPKLKDSILNRNGKVIIRPDSGDPVEIICGKPSMYYTFDDEKVLSDFLINMEDGDKFEWKGKYYLCNYKQDYIEEYGEETIYHLLSRSSVDKSISNFLEEGIIEENEFPITPENKGLIECLWEIFGGTINEKGYKVLNDHIGAIYGDSITYDRAYRILKVLEKKGFTSSNIVFGLGSFTFQYVTRDTHGFAMKSTNSIINGVSSPIFKDPKTDDGTKRSAKGFLRVDKVNGKYVLKDEVSFKESEEGELKVTFLNGTAYNKTTLKEIRERAING